MITKEDFAYFQKTKKDAVLIQHQLICLRSKEVPFSIQKPATLGDGIHEFPLDQQDNYRGYFDQHGSHISAIKFVPASGAASRMFKHLYNIKSPSQSIELVNHFFNKISHFPFYKELEKILNADKLNLSKLVKNKKYHIIANKILSSNGLDYGNVPKGMVKFHRYEDNSRTAFEEHLIEGLNYCKNNKNEVNIHFTISDTDNV